MQVLEQQVVVPIPSVVEVDERSARRTLRDQISKLERDLCATFVGAFPRTGIDWSVAAPGGPRVLSLGELERVRDDLSDRLRDTRAELARRARVEQEHRELIEHMLVEPRAYKWVKVTHADIGLPGCKSWHVRPRLGIVGMFMGWWQVKISSGCPLAT